jgi:hypothetical protein
MMHDNASGPAQTGNASGPAHTGTASALLSEPRATRRGVLALLGAGALAPAVTMALARARPDPTLVEGLEFHVLGATRRVLPRHDGVKHDPETSSWPDVVRVHLEVLNTATSAVLVSPGQFRLRVGDLTVMPTAWQHSAGPFEGRLRRATWIDYRAPESADLLHLEFTPAGASSPVSVAFVAVSGGRP